MLSVFSVCWMQSNQPNTSHIRTTSICNSKSVLYLGKPVANLITNYGCLGQSERAPRVTVWGEDNMQLNKGGRMRTLIDEQQRLVDD